MAAGVPAPTASPETALACRLLVSIGVLAAGSPDSGLAGLQLDRDVLLCSHRYEQAKALIPEFRLCLSSSRLTSLQATAGRQRWPLLNLVRQVLTAAGFKLLPRRRSAGYGPGRKKLYSRGFLVVAAAKSG